jgi:CheY-like chemotaxis protein
MLALLLTQEGYEVVTASDGEEALLRLGERPPALVVTDYWMPKLDGVELCRRMQEDERWRGIPVLMLTAIHEPAGVPAVAGLTAVLAKPLHYPELLEVVGRLLARGSAQ